MHFHPDPSVPFVQLQRTRSPRKTKMPMSTTRAPSQFALAPNEETSRAALRKGFASREHEIQLHHVRSAIVTLTARIHGALRIAGPG